jgi:leader peptidase (prepilin peptidase)/N-methyltransferase
VSGPEVAEDRAGGAEDDVAVSGQRAAPRTGTETGLETGVEAGLDTGEPKERYVAIAGLPGLAQTSAATAAVAAGLVGAVVGWDPVLVVWAYLVTVGVALGIVDWRTRLLPTRVIAPSYAVLVVLTLLAALVSGDVDSLVRAGWGWLVAGGTFFVLWFLYPRGMGYGDVRLSGLLGICLGYLGWAELLTGVYAGFILGGVGGLLLSSLRIVDRRAYPFGPFMLVGALVGVLLGPGVAAWYA